MKLINLSKNTIISSNVKMADTFLSRLLGLIPKSSIGIDEGLIIKPCNSIHSYFMRFPIDVLFVNRENSVVHILSDFKPWRLSRIIKDSKFVIELHASMAEKTNTQIGDRIKIEE